MRGGCFSIRPCFFGGGGHGLCVNTQNTHLTLIKCVYGLKGVWGSYPRKF